MRTLMLAALAVAVTAAPARAQDVDALIRKAAATYAAARTATAHFEQTLTNPMTGTRSVSRGVMRHQQPNRYDVRFTEPSGDRMVSDGTHLWVYVPSTNPGQVMKLPLAAAGAVPLDPGAQFFKAPRERFDIQDGGTATLDGRILRKLVLTPKGNTEAFTRATVWLDPRDGTLRQFETVDGMGVTRLVRITDLALNAPVKAATFSFTPPAGVRVVDQRTMMGGGAPAATSP